MEYTKEHYAQFFVKKETKYCLRCKKVVYDSNRFSPYCSHGCEFKAISLEGVCKNCNKPFNKNLRTDKYCSKECNKAFYKHKYRSDAPPTTSRFKILARDGFICIYCGASAHDGSELTIDHVYPLIGGGGSDLFNLVACCTSCNSEKQGKILPIKTINRIWKIAHKRNSQAGLMESYAELKAEFEKLYKSRTKIVNG